MGAFSLPLYRRIFVTVFLLLLFGQIMLFSATGVLGLKQHGSEFYYVSRQSTLAILGVGVMFLFSQIKYQFWYKVAVPIFWGQLVITAATLFSPLAHTAQGVNRWLKLGPITFQPSELAKVSIAIYVAYLLKNYQSNQFPLKKALLYSLPIPLLLACIYKQPDLGSTVLILCTLIATLFIAGARPTYLLGTVGVGSFLFYLALLSSDYRQRRVLAYLNPWADPQGKGFQTIQSFLSFYSGKFLGVGIGNGNSKLFFLPEVHTDFIFALVGEELGFLGTLCLLLVFAYLGYLCFRAVRHASDSFGRYLSFALSISLLLQIMVNIGGVTGILPVKGLPLPFISWGRTALLMNLVMVGILLNVVKQSGLMHPNEMGRASPRKIKNTSS